MQHRTKLRKFRTTKSLQPGINFHPLRHLHRPVDFRTESAGQCRTWKGKPSRSCRIHLFFFYSPSVLTRAIKSSGVGGQSTIGSNLFFYAFTVILIELHFYFVSLQIVSLFFYRLLVWLHPSCRPQRLLLAWSAAIARIYRLWPVFLLTVPFPVVQLNLNRMSAVFFNHWNVASNLFCIDQNHQIFIFIIRSEAVYLIK